MSSSRKTYNFSLSAANKLMEDYVKYGALLEEYDTLPDPDHRREVAQKRAQLDKMAASFAEESRRTVEDSKNPVDKVISKEQMHEWVEAAHDHLTPKNIPFRITFTGNYASSGVSLLLTAPSPGWWYVLGGTCHPKVREDQKCGGIHGPWRNSRGDYVKFKALTDREIITAALTAWHSGENGDMRTVTESGEVTVTSEQGSGSWDYTLSGGHASVSVSVEELPKA